GGNVSEFTARLVGITGLIVCAPKTMNANEVIAKANRDEPTGVGPWRHDTEFRTTEGFACPVECLDDVDQQHWMLCC
ncbi:MAG TPA: hypothetical protein VJP78_05720, partial [Thermoleophilia bacterium]|nr:hypothetical protein [Thermoleophilia bacterium]